MTVTIERVAGSLGAIVHGLDVRSLSTEGHRDLTLALAEHLVVFLPDQALTLDDLEAFTDALGGRDITPYVTPVEGRPYVIQVLKERDDELNFANAWHSDLSYLPAPPSYTVLHAWDVPDFGGDTLWANQYLAFETLPGDLQADLRTRRAVHSAGPAYGTGGYLEAVADKSSMRIEPSVEAHGVHVHPVVVRHPVTGREALYVNPVYTQAIEGMTDHESRALLRRLFEHSVHPNLTCRIRWRPQMLAIWDNRCTQHFAINDYSGQRREMFRTSVCGSAPIPSGGR
jgi:taurine dioxygenase